MSIKLTVKEKEYKLEYNRRIVAMMDKQGFNVNKVEDNPLTMLTLLYRSAFKMNHPTLSDDKIDEVWKGVRGKQKLIAKLVEMYGNTIQSVLSDEEEIEEGNENWVEE